MKVCNQEGDIYQGDYYGWWYPLQMQAQGLYLYVDDEGASIYECGEIGNGGTPATIFNKKAVWFRLPFDVCSDKWAEDLLKELKPLTDKLIESYNDNDKWNERIQYDIERFIEGLSWETDLYFYDNGYSWEELILKWIDRLDKPKYQTVEGLLRYFDHQINDGQLRAKTKELTKETAEIIYNEFIEESWQDGNDEYTLSDSEAFFEFVEQLESQAEYP